MSFEITMLETVHLDGAPADLATALHALGARSVARVCLGTRSSRQHVRGVDMDSGLHIGLPYDASATWAPVADPGPGGLAANGAFVVSIDGAKVCSLPTRFARDTYGQCWATPARSIQASMHALRWMLQAIAPPDRLAELHRGSKAKDGGAKDILWPRVADDPLSGAIVATGHGDGRWTVRPAPVGVRADGAPLDTQGNEVFDTRPYDAGMRARITVWKGDITTLKVDAIVNAANERLGGCGVPGHCIDAAICLAAGPQLLAACSKLGGCDTGQVKVTPGFRLPARYVLHTVGPRVGFDMTFGDPPRSAFTAPDPVALAACYTGCLDVARRNRCRSVAFCCISTGVFGYDKRQACSVACRAVRGWMRDWSASSAAPLRVIFCVFTDEQRDIYDAGVARYFGTESV